ncbi:MAG: rRNA adenine N-6-methyltransferase family protein, partial [Candidatus Verstraetearchaeota archaeon]|nr:rRNA adenine N-6-methyltransferase family protein [Candidatus Verstraetearchaeota archaeon]
LPYSISTPITFKLLFNDKFNFGALSYQKEVADRLVALPATPQYSRISVAVSLLADVRRVADFPPDSFYPPPMVSSTVVVIKRRQTSKRIDWTNFDSALKFLFSQRKRTLRKALETYSKVSGEKMSVVEERIAKELLTKRVFELTPSEFVEISTALEWGLVGGRR